MKILKWTAVVLILFIIGLYSFVQLAWDKKYDPPEVNLSASTDSTLIARGKYLVYGTARCASCHVSMEKLDPMRNGEIVPLIGGWELDLPPGVFRAPNLTPDMETGIGRLSDGEIARMLRYQVGSDGRFKPIFMAYQNLSDEDIRAILSFLRSQEPVRHEVKPTRIKFIGKALLAFGFFKPEGPKGTPPMSIARDTTAVYGEYLVKDVTGCLSCHSIGDPSTDAYERLALSGGQYFEPSNLSEGYGFVSPNLTPHPETGIMAHWNEMTFVSRFQAGAVYPQSPMPWGSFSRMDNDDLKAIYRYLKALDPVDNKVRKTVYTPGEKFE